ncbi:MAG: O-antigen ligase family protein [Candidatus Limivicinus sp.]|nr:O-antigen ligase family protein [Candidatus Limivicinus sp.]
MNNSINNNARTAFVRNHWLMALIVMQPLLDIIAFWTKNPDGTLAGYVRLLIMVCLPLYLLFTLRGSERKSFIFWMLGIGLVCALHIANTIRTGPVSLGFDISYTAKVAQMPILAVCFMYSIKNDQTRNQAYWGLFFAAGITAAALGLSVLTGTANCTYGEGLGVSGWVIDDNRCANSIILVTLAAFSIFCAVKSDKPFVNIAVPVVSAVVLIANGTMTCYMSIFVIFIGFAVFLLLEKKIRGCNLNRLAVIALVAVAIASAAAYPLTPKYKIKQTQSDFAELTQDDFNDELGALGYDLDSMSNEEKLSNPEIHTALEDYYWKCLWIITPNMFERFDIDEIMLKYDLTTDAATLIDTRTIKNAYASLMWDHSDTLTKLFGIDVSDIWLTGGMDLENDWPAIRYYYGYVGFATYAAFILYFVYLIIRRLCRDFKGSFTADNFILLVTFALLIGLAQYSGAVLRRPNVSIYLALVLGLIHYQTAVNPGSRITSWRGEWI